MRPTGTLKVALLHSLDGLNNFYIVNHSKSDKKAQI